MMSLQMAITRRGVASRTVIASKLLTRGIAGVGIVSRGTDFLSTTRKCKLVQVHQQQRKFSYSGETKDEVYDSAENAMRYTVPKRTEQKLISAEDAVALVRDGDTVAVSGFVTQGAAELVLQALGARFAETASPRNLTLLFGGGPGDYGERGLSHLAKEKDGICMLQRTIGGHYGQVPKVAELALANKVEAWTLPMGSISRMIRSQSTHSPGHITTVGIGTYVDPDISGGAANEAALASPLHSQLVSKMEIMGQTNLMYKALPIDVAIIRGTTSDKQGNISVEHESLLCDQRVLAAAAKNSGGIVIAQVKRVAENGSIPTRSVAVPAPLVDCVVVVDEKDHPEMHGMSYYEHHNPYQTGELKSPQGEMLKLPLNIRKMIARRAFFGLKPNKVVNLGIGLPEGVASVAAEEGMLEYVTLSTEPGVFGGLPVSGHGFGPAYNASSLMEMNAMFDFYDGGGLDMSFLGAAEVASNGDVNVSRMSEDRLTGPGGFIDISQSTSKICFMTPFTVKGLEVSATKEGNLQIDKEGQVKKFVKGVYEKTFSGDEAVRRGQKVYYVTERAVFQRTAKHEKLELVEIAPGLDLQKDILDQMDFEPAISPNLKTMDTRIYIDEPMKVNADFFGSLEDRCQYHADDHTMYIDLFGITLSTEEDVKWFADRLTKILDPLVAERGKINLVANYEGFDLGKGLENYYSELISKIQDEYYATVKRYTGRAFKRAQLKGSLSMSEWNADDLFDEFDADGNGTLSLEELREGLMQSFQIHLTPSDIREFQSTEGEIALDKAMFAEGIKKVLERKTGK